MPEHTLAERLKSRTDERIAANDENEQRASIPDAPTKAPVKEKVGTGTSSFDLEGAIAKLRARIKSSDDSTLKAKLEARIKALKDNQ